ncbi:hypothetical protein DL764_002202 [Monosporascus ibericus]|uniref:Uncharacterized protein n=1 Tax=Monosporascus ibericus TaxID=155417 RepID=A0A4Q4TLC8_9PEZI|nr:hypothetical protein DL764_002202 [Monosporascus ibericus]
MASVNHTSELMDLHLAAVPVPSSRRFVTVRDEFGLPMLFSAGTNGDLFTIKENSSGARTLVNLSNAFGMPHDRVIAFDCVQDDATDLVYLAFATENKDGSATLHVARPFSPLVIDVEEDYKSLDLNGLLMPWSDTSKALSTISKIYMGAKSSRTGYPEVILEFKQVRKINSSQDLARVRIAEGMESFKLMYDFELPENASDMLDIAPATLPVGKGYFSIYRVKGETRLLFSTTDRIRGYQFDVALSCPEGARTCSTFIDADGYSSLVVGGNGLFYWTANQAMQRGAVGRKVSYEDDFNNIDNLFIGQAGVNLTIFVTNTARGLTYGVTDNLVFQDPVDDIPLIPDFEGGVFSMFISPDGLTQQVIVSKGTGGLELLCQDSIDGIWKRVPFAIPSLTENVQLKGYMSRVTFTAPNGDRVANQPVLLSTAGYSQITVNGRDITTSPTGVLVMTDVLGTLTLLTPADDLTSDIFTLSNPGGDYPGFLDQDIYIDPSDKIWEKLETIKTGVHLGSARLPSGEKLVSDPGVSNANLDAVAAGIKEVTAQRRKLKAQETTARRLAAKGTDSRLVVGPRRGRSSHKPQLGAGGPGPSGTIIAGVNVERFRDARRKIRDFFFDALHWVVGTAQKVASWAIEVTLDGLYFLLEIPGLPNFMRIGIDALIGCVQVIDSIMQGMLGGLDKLITWIEYLFDWKGILATQKVIVGFVDRGLVAAPKHLDTLAGKAEAWFDELREVLKQITYPDAALEQKITQDDVKKAGTDILDAGGSAEGEYMNYQVSHGGAMLGLLPSGPSSITGSAIVDALLETLRNLAKEFGDIFINAWDNISRLWKGTGELSVGDVFQKLGADIVLDVLDMIKALAVGVIEIGAGLLSDLRSLLNQQIELPVLSALYKGLTGSDLTILNVIGLLIAVPANATYKTMFGDSKIMTLDGADLDASLSAAISGIPASIRGAGRSEEDIGPTDSQLDLDTGLGSCEVAIRIVSAVLTFLDVGADDNVSSTPAASRPAHSPSRSDFSIRDKAGQLSKFSSPIPVARLDLTTLPSYPSGNGGAALRKERPKASEVIPFVLVGLDVASAFMTFPYYWGLAGAQDKNPPVFRLRMGSWSIDAMLFFIGGLRMKSREVDLAAPYLAGVGQLCSSIFSVSALIVERKGEVDDAGGAPLEFTIAFSNLVGGLSFAAADVLKKDPKLALVARMDFVGVVRSIAAYRLLFHPLRDYPGPLAAKLSDAYNGYFSFRKRLHLTSMEDHSTYGPVIRHGPNKLLFNSSKALHDIYDNDKLVKSYVNSAILQAPGAFSTSAGICALFFYLAHNRRCYERLANEIRETFTSASEIQSGTQLSNCHYLRACIDEALRIAPPVPGTLWRELASDEKDKPLIIDGHLVPPQTQVGANIYTLHHNEKYFPDPYMFRPERWLSSETPESQRNLMREAFTPFSIGYRGCAGKAMAYLESSLVVAKSLWYFDFKLAPGQLGEVGGGAPGRTDSRGRRDEYQLYDVIAGEHDGPYLVFTPRGDACKGLQVNGLTFQ